MNSIQEIFRRYAPEYLELHGERLPQNHRKTIQAIINCRSGSLGTSFYKCAACGSLLTFILFIPPVARSPG
jgi:hypothetical protein